MAGRASAEQWQQRFSQWLTGEQNDEEHRGFCPLHEDPATSKTPSASFNFSRGAFNCFSKCGGARISQVWELIRDDPQPSKSNVRSINSARSARVRSEGEQQQDTLPTEVEVKGWHERLMRGSTIRGKLREARGLNDSTLQEYLIGWDGSRYTIPVYDREGTLVNVRRYKMGVAKMKVVSYTAGSGSSTIYGADALKHKEILLCEGEMDKLIARQYGFHSMTATTGANSWPDEWTPKFKGKRVYIAYDNDDAGIRGARKVAVRLLAAGAEVYVLRLPVADKQDLTDYFVNQGYSAQQLKDLMAQTPPYEHRAVSPRAAKAKPVDVPIEETMNAELVDKPIEFLGTVAGKQAVPYTFPRRLAFNCGMEWNKAKCGRCSMEMYYGGQHEATIESDDKVLLRMVAKPEDQQQKELLKRFEIQPNCPEVELTALEHWSVEQLVVVPSIDDPTAATNVRREVFNVGSHKTPVNSTVKLVGVNTADPRSGQMTMQTWECHETQTSLDAYRVSEEDLVDLSVFQPSGEQRASDKLWEIAEDLGANVTHIYGRPELHVAYDLVWHSLLDFRFRRANLGKGWLELLVMGDTRTGKSEAAQRLTKHYRAGTLTSCEGATLAGLVGGAQQVNSNWVITWGTIPLHDRRLVVLDEVSGLKDKGVLEQMSEVRSSGRAKVTKIVSQETNARTRLIWISNPVDGRAIAEMPRGAIDAIQDLITTPEDVARFDMAMVAAKSDVKSSIINAARPPKVAHVYTSDLCSRLVLWAWSRSARDVKWEMGAERLVLRLAELIGQRYIPDPPLLQAENARVKLARMSVAIAARLFSHDGTGQKVYVTKEHVRTARRFLDLLYRQPNFGYADHSLKEIRSRERAAAYRRDCWNYLRANEDVAEALKAVVNDKEFRTKDFIDLGGMQPELASHAVAQLLKMQMLRRHTRGYLRMQPELTELVRRLQDREYRRWETP